MNAIASNALRWVNKFRKQMGKPALKRLPRGKPNKVFACPVANALDGGLIGVTGEELTVPLDLLHCFLEASTGARFMTEQKVTKRKGQWYVTIRAPRGIQEFVEWFDMADTGSEEYRQ